MARRHTLPGSLFSLAAIAIVTIGITNPPVRTHAKPTASASARDELRGKIATLRGEIGLLQLEDEADHAILLELLKASAEDRQELKASFTKPYTGASDADVATYFDELLGASDYDQVQVEALKKKFDAAVASGDPSSRKKTLKELLDLTFDVEAKAHDRKLDRRKAAYKDRLIQMTEKKLLLEDALKRYRETE